MGIAARKQGVMRAFLIGLVIGAIGVFYVVLNVSAAVSTITPEGQGSQNDATQQGSCPDAGNNATCIYGFTSTSSSPSGTYLSAVNGDIDFFTMTTISGVATATTIRIPVFHVEASTNMRLDVSLCDISENCTVYGSAVTLPLVTGAADWSTAEFAVDMAGTPDLDQLRVRIGCTRPGTGKATQCDYYAMYGQVIYTEQIDVLVATTSSQRDLLVGTTSAHVGGAFVISEIGGGSRNVTSIEVTENGTVNAATDLTNIRLYYETVADCSAAAFDSNEAQFGATTSAFSAADGFITFSGTSVNINSSNEMCIYPVLDVRNTASADETIELEISDPTTDLAISGTPVISPSTAVELFDTTTLLKADLQQIRYHWRDDNGTETSGSGSLTSGTEDTSLDNAGVGTTYRVRMEVSNEGNITSESMQYRLEYGVKTTECVDISDGSWVDVGAGGGDWDMAGAGSGLTEPASSTDIANGIGGVTNENASFWGKDGQKETSSQTMAIELTSSQYYEVEWAIQAQGSASPGTTYCFRLTDAGATSSMNYVRYPEATIAADLLVTATSSQPTTVGVPKTDVYGGGFVITDATAGAHTIDSFTITASGTIDLQNDVEDITLRYESDTTVPLDCTGETYSGTETIYGAVDTNGFSVNGTSTFTEVSSPPSIENGVNALCFYIEYNVTASTTDGESIEFSVANAATDVVPDAGSVSPASLVDIDGYTTFVSPIVTQEHYHWRDNLGTEATAGSAVGAEDTIDSEIPRNSTIRLRFGVSNTGGTTTSAYQYQLEWAQRISTCEDVTVWTDIDVPGDDWATSSSQLIDGNPTTDVSVLNGGVTNVGTIIFPSGGQNETDGLSQGITLDTGEFVELEYAIAADVSVTEGSSYCFRLTNNGSDLTTYDVYAEASIKLATDFKIQRGTTTIANGVTTASISPGGGNYEAPASASTSFIRIINSGYTGRGPAAGTTGNLTSADVTTYIANPANITSGITFQRAGTTGDTVIKWEIIEYIGAPGGDNEISVRGQGVVTYGTAATVASSTTISPVASSSDMVVFITAQGNPNTGRFNYNTGLSTAAWNASNNVAVFTRGEAGGDAVNTTYAAVEFKGANWRTQRVEMNYLVVGATTTSMRAVNNTHKAFVHAQHRAGLDEDEHADFGHEVWISGLGQLTFRINNNLQTPTLHTSVAWVIENTQQVGDVMEVEMIQSTVPDGGGGLTVVQDVPFGFTVDDLSVTSLTFMSTNSGVARSFPEPILGAQIVSDSAFDIEVTDDAGSNIYTAHVIEWPTAARKLIQNGYRFYVDNDANTPTDAWPDDAVILDDLGEDTPIGAADNPVAVGESVRIRMNLEVTAASMPAGVDAMQLEYAVNPGTCTAATEWYLLGDISSTTALWSGHGGAVVDGVTLSQTLLSDSNVAATYEEEVPTALTPNLAVVGDFIEFDWNVEHNGAAQKTDYCFRMVESDRTEIEDYITYPTVRTAGYGPEIGNWQWFDDATNTTPVSSLANELFAPSDVANDNEIKLRLVLAERGGADGTNVKFGLQFSETADFSASVHDVVSSTTCATATSTAHLWCYVDGAGDDSQIIDQAVLSDADACVGGVGNGCGTYNEGTTTPSTLTHSAYTNTEFEFTIKNDGARVNAVYYFRLYDLVNDEALIASTSYPSLQVEGASLVFQIVGLPAGTSTEGIVTDVSTTPTAINFGSVPIGSEHEAAQRIRVDTNATEGYQVLLFTRQKLLNSYGTPIDDVATTNLLPGGWGGTACLVSATSCFGYHAGDDALSGGSVRFAADDSYAALSTTTEEVLFSSVPIDDSNDIVYKLEVGELQPAGDYETDLVYIAIPTF